MAVIAPDLGAVKLAERYALRLRRRPLAVVRKTRVSGEQVEAHELVGDVTGRPAVIIDDMISTGATIEAAVAMAFAHGAAGDVVVAATHGLLVAGAMARMSSAGVRRVLITDTSTERFDGWSSSRRSPVVRNHGCSQMSPA